MNLYQKLKVHLSSRDLFALTLVAAGFILRLRQYLTGRSLWLDEAMLANNIVSRSFAGLTQWLDYDQQAPIGFLWLQKTATQIFGDSEYALRLIPLLAGCAALGVMYLLSRRLSALAGLTALALFAFSSPLIYYTSEAKQYICDVFIALSLLTLYLHLNERGHQRRDIFLLAFSGAIAIWFSHPAIFILAALGVVLFFQSLRQKSTAGWTLLLGGFWLGSFALFYILFARRSVNADVLRVYWGDAFLPLTARAAPWLATAFENSFRDSAGLDLPILFGAALALIGFIGLLRRNKMLALILTLPIFFALLASAFGAYPFAGRMLLFLTPAYFLLWGFGLETLATLFHIPESFWARGLLAASLIFFAARVSLPLFAAPKYQEHIRPTIEYLRDARKDGDLVYVYFWAEPAFRFYAPKYGIGPEGVFNGTDLHATPDAYAYAAELAPLRGHDRVWFIFSHVYERDGFNERESILNYLDSIGNLLREYRVRGTSVYLYLYDLEP